MRRTTITSENARASWKASNTGSSVSSTTIALSSASLTMKLSSSRCRRGLSVCSTAAMHGTAKYSSRCSGWFHNSVATGSPSPIPSSDSAVASRLERSMQSPIVVWPTDPSGRRNATFWLA